MKKIEEIILDKKEHSTLRNVEFVPPKFGAYTLACVCVGYSVGILSNGVFIFGGIALVGGLLLMLVIFSKRGEW